MTKPAWNSLNSRVFSMKMVRDDQALADYGEGLYIYDTNGKRYFDGSSGALTANIGHGIREIADAVAEQISKLAFVFRAHFSNKPAEDLADRIIAYSPPGFSKLFYTCSGADAVDAALKIARQYQRDIGEENRYKFISRRKSFHGLTLGALSVTEPNMFRDAGGWDPMVHRARYIELLSVEDLEAAILDEGPSSVAAFIGEPTRGEVPPTDYWPRMKAVCEKYGVLFIADEVATGFWRTGVPFAMQRWNVVPDIFTFGKGAAAGYAPLAGVVVSDKVFKTMSETTGYFVHNHTYTAHPASCAAGVAVQDYASRNGLYEKVEDNGKKLDRVLLGIVNDLPEVEWTSGIGLLRQLAIRLPAQGKPNQKPLNPYATLMQSALLEGLLTMCWNDETHVGFQLAPPFCITDAQMDELGVLLRKTTNRFLQKMAGG